MRNTMPFNFTGLPAVSTPCGLNEQGLPIGVQIIGHSFDEATTLRIAMHTSASQNGHAAVRH